MLEKLYGSGNVAVSVKGTLNMERLIQENTQYSTPEKINEQDKTGLLNREDTINENSAASDQGAGGVAGADANADTPRYTNQDNTQAIADSYSNSSATREWLYNSVKEQRQVDPGVLENATVGIVINTDDTTTVTNNQLINLVADSAGIPRDLANQSITIVRAPSQEAVPVITPPEQPQTKDDGLPLPIVIAMIAGGILILLLLLLLLMEKRRRRRKADEYVDSPNMYAVEEEARAPETEAPPVNVLNTEAGLQMQAENAEMERNEEILNLRMQHSLKLKQNIGEFVDQNPQIAAKLVQSWLRGEVGDIAGNRRRKER
nr:flagellar M-ring protein FliF C-terminal domain-containing protein [Enterocloster bolteae]